VRVGKVHDIGKEEDKSTMKGRVDNGKINAYYERCDFSTMTLLRSHKH
jgi:hypothetical protein